jgi:hypothetical protein
MQVKTVIRKGQDGFEINFGQLVIAELDGTIFAIDEMYAKIHGISFTVVEEIPEFVFTPTLWIQRSSSQAIVHVFDKKDLGPLGVALSGIDKVDRVDANHKARILQIWKNGEAFSERKTIDEFYLDMTPEEIEASRF